jgi:hypothetical protein
VLSYLAPDGKENEQTHKFMSITLLQCYKLIDDTSIEEFSDVNLIDAMTEKNKNLLQVERWAELFKGKAKDLENEIDKLNDALVDFVPEEERRKMMKEDDFSSDDFVTPPKPIVIYDLLFFGYDISDPVIKYTIGFSFLVFLFSLLYFLLYKMMKPAAPVKTAKISFKKKK